ncbi:MAG: SpoIVB peptidase [Lachnospiraceae bacterium]|nr:SpoIVB peptidase [Lachnospiraceae bacterium]
MEQVLCKRRKKGWLIVLISIVSLIFISIYGYYWMKVNVPSEIKLMLGQEESFDFSVPMEASVFGEEATGVLYVNQEPLEEGVIEIDLQKPFSVSSESLGQYEVLLKLFGLIPIKEISVEVIEEPEVIPGGDVIGLQIETEGILVLGTGTVTLKDGTSAEPAKGRLFSGDYIIGINGKTGISRQDLLNAINSTVIELLVNRAGKEIKVSIQPVQDYSGKYKLGAWIRTDAQGIGTITYITGNGKFGALGHGITDVDTGLMMEVGSGKLFDAEVLSVVKGKNGIPGEIIGIIRQSGISQIGEIDENCNKGIYGHIKLGMVDASKTVPVALKQDIELGEATILCQVDSEVREYKIEIERIELGRTNDNKGLVIHITDEELLKKTGGIVQGMSGSPILQNGKLIGAVTHVLVNDPTRGYGIFIENMLEH